eukprot:m.199443 g.199443  ORF g.199443 m.199443 type:complete len:455 (-) comp32734_c0_seq1:608-1972(-)
MASLLKKRLSNSFQKMSMDAKSNNEATMSAQMDFQRYSGLGQFKGFFEDLLQQSPVVNGPTHLYALTIGPKAALSAMRNNVSEMAIYAALFLSCIVPAMLEPPEKLRYEDKAVSGEWQNPWRITYIVGTTAAICGALTTIITAIMLNYADSFAWRDADVLRGFFNLHISGGNFWTMNNMAISGIFTSIVGMLIALMAITRILLGASMAVIFFVLTFLFAGYPFYYMMGWANSMNSFTSLSDPDVDTEMAKKAKSLWVCGKGPAPGSIESVCSPGIHGVIRDVWLPRAAKGAEYDLKFAKQRFEQYKAAGTVEQLDQPTDESLFGPHIQRPRIIKGKYTVMSQNEKEAGVQSKKRGKATNATPQQVVLQMTNTSTLQTSAIENHSMKVFLETGAFDDFVISRYVELFAKAGVTVAHLKTVISSDIDPMRVLERIGITNIGHMIELVAMVKVLDSD